MPKQSKKPTTDPPKGVKKNKHKRCFKAHLRLQHEQLIQVRQLVPDPTVQLLTGLLQRQAVANQARVKGTRFPFAFGGSYDIVAAANKQVRDDIYMEANHSPPCDAYTGTGYDHHSYGSRPAHAMLFYHHRAPRGRIGGLTSTGGSGLNKPWAEQLRDHMAKGDFYMAMYLDFMDILNTTHPNVAYYALSLHRCALYALHMKLIDQSGMAKISGLYGELLSGDDFGAAFTDTDEAI